MRSACLLALAATLCARPLEAQEFSGPAPPAAGTAAALLEAALPPSGTGPRVELLATRWHGLPELVTRAVSSSVAWRQGRAALGLSQTGTDDLAWTALVAGLGLVQGGAGAGVRASWRGSAALPSQPSRHGVDVGVGAWVTLEGLEVWSSAPQLWGAGEPPPLPRWLELGARIRVAGAKLWLSRAAVPAGTRVVGEEHEAGLEARAGALEAWLRARDGPLRGGFGVAGRAGWVSVAAEVEGHPVLGETVRLAVVIEGAAR